MLTECKKATVYRCLKIKWNHVACKSILEKKEYFEKVGDTDFSP